MRTLLALALAILAGLPLSLRADKLSFVTTEFPPYIIKQGNELSGLQVDIVRELCRRLGHEPDIRVVPWNRALGLVKGGQVDGIFMPVYTKERAEFLYFTAETSGRERISVMQRQGGDIRATTLEDLYGELIGTVLSYSYGRTFDGQPHLRKDVSTTNELMLKKLAIGRYRLVVSDEGVARYLARQTGELRLETVLVLQDNPQYIGFAKTLGKRGEALAEQFSEALRQLKRDGVLKDTEDRYLAGL
ncbi:transporter substrate-binding domain-containing protein [Chitinimonas arctica]|uniref:Transporter substrate-binding domain-containing protein n=1 Tax=Chitinimonas arctica TaxID=2594795 RepID=A0A516SFT8_9NEIS|nr:transporter substrate-binding domain-containing protein [Chitinimonas arctica]QDQ27012.1 transporter substrate-binding domain-containing protein [Chitinimonas arctica]